MAGDLGNIESLFSAAETIAAEAMELLLERMPGLRSGYDERRMRLAREDMAQHVRHLAAAALANDEAALLDYLSWLKVLFTGLGLPDESVALSLRCAGAAACARLGEPDAGIFAELSERAAREYGLSDPAVNRYLAEGLPDKDIARAYVQALMDGRRDLATALVESRLREGIPLWKLYLGLFQPAQREIGRLWHLRKVSVAQEHFATAATQFIMSSLYGRLIADARPNGKRMVAACAQGELHELGLRMVADFFQADGWDTRFLGANLPVEALVAELEREQADLVALSASTQPNVRLVEEAIRALRPEGPAGGAAPFLLVGGIPFLVSPGLWRQVGADATGADCQAAVLAGDRLVGVEPSPWLKDAP
jgi:methanogenic corrinoid protein MtbC1